MHVVSTNFAKRWLGNVNMASYGDVTNSVYPVTMTTTRHCSILEFGRGACTVAILEFKKWGDRCGAKEKVGGPT